MALLQTFEFDPDEYLDYTWDWTGFEGAPWLKDGETIASQTVTAPPGFAVDQVGRDDTNTKVTAWVQITDRELLTSVLAQITCHVVTSDGRKADRSIVLRIKNR